MSETGPTPPEWTQWLNAATAQGLSMLGGIGTSLGGPADFGANAPIFVAAWQHALNSEDQAPDPDTAASRFSEAVEQSLQRMHEGTRAGMAAVDGALQGTVQAQQGGDWLGDAYRTARQHSGSQQDPGEALRKAFQDYMEALRAYQAEFHGSIEAALEAFRSALNERHQAGEPPQTLEALHRLWIDAAEPAYEAALNSDAYARSFAALQNAAVALGKALQQQARPFLEALGVPSQQEVDELRTRLSEMRRERNRSRRLEAEVALMRRELDTLRQQLEADRDKRSGSTRGDDQ